MRFQIIKPNGLLSNYIKHYCFMESMVEEGEMTERVIPTDGVQLMFHYRNPFVVKLKGDIDKNQPRSILSGLSDTFSDVSTNGEVGVVFIQFYPVGASHFFSFPLSEIKNQSVDLLDVFRSEVNQIEEQLYLHKIISDKVKVIENFLMARFNPLPGHDYHLIQEGVNLIKNNQGQISVSVLSDKLSATTKSLERKFSQYIGKTPKQFIKLIRYQSVLQNLSNGGKSSLTNQAYLNGYFDQSHFIRDFKAFTGYTPKEFNALYPDCGPENVI